MKVLHKLFAGILLVTLAVFGMTALSSSSSDSADTTQVWAFLNTTCNSEVFVLLDSTKDMLELRGQSRWGIVLDFQSYYRVAELHLPQPPCHLVAALLAEPPVRTIRSPLPRIPSPPPKPQPPANPQHPKPPANPADGFSEEDADTLKTCWEEKAINLPKRKQKKIGGYKPKDLVSTSRNSGAVWKNTSGVYGALARTVPTVTVVDEKKTLSILVEIFTDGITASIQKYSEMHFQYNHLVTYAQMHETFHIAQVKKLFDDEKREPHPYEYWEMEVDAHVAATDLWAAIYSDPSPTYLPGTERPMSEKYQKMVKEYKDLEGKKKKGTITKAEKVKMEQLAKDLRKPANLPQADGNPLYNPATDLECELEEDED